MEKWAEQRERASAQRPRKMRESGDRFESQDRAVAVAVPSSQGKGRRASCANSDSLESLVISTAKLSLETARKVRQLGGIALRTITMPESAPLTAQLLTMCTADRGFAEKDHIFQWAELIQCIIRVSPEQIDAQWMKILKDHAAACVSPDNLLGLISECSVSQTFAGNAVNVRLAVNSDLQTVSQCLIKSLVAVGGTLRFGAPPRTALERSTSSALAARQKQS